MHTNTTDEGATKMTNATIELLEASERVERAQADLAAAERWQRTVSLTTPLAIKVADQRRVDAARDELDAARVAYETAQDSECPEA